MSNVKWFSNKRSLQVFAVLALGTLMAGLHFSRQLPVTGDHNKAEELATEFNLRTNVAMMAWGGRGFRCDFEGDQTRKTSLTAAAEAVHSFVQYLSRYNLRERADGTLWVDDWRMENFRRFHGQLELAMLDCPERPSSDIENAWNVLQQARGR